MSEAPPRDDWLGCLALGYLYYFLTSLAVLVGVLFAERFVIFCHRHPSARIVPALERCAAWDGEWYARIIEQGYSYNADQMSSVAFPPAFPLLAALVHRITSLPTIASLLVVSHALLIGSFVLMAAYLARRWGEPGTAAQFALLSLGLFPAGFYFRMAYSESMFLFLALASMFGMERRWPTPIIAAVIGLATATRLTALALLAPFATHLWQTSANWRTFALKTLAMLPLCCSGLLAYAAYQQYLFGDALAFMRTSAHWNHRAPATDVVERVAGLLTLEPLRAVYTPGSPCYWRTKPPEGNAAFNLFFANPIYFVLTAGLVGIGYQRGWLNGKEMLLGAALLLIPYITHAQRGCMASEARYASVVFPAYMTLGQLLSRLPPPATAVFAALSACLLAAYSALFGSWYWFY